MMAYELLRGVHPFAHRTTSQQLIAAHITEKPAPLGREVPRQVATLVMAAVAKSPTERPQSAGALLAALDAPPSANRAMRAPAALVTLVVVATTAVVWTLTRPHVPARHDAAITSVAVLPFTNVGGDSSDAYFSDGVADELSGVLAKIPDLRVASRRAVYALKDRSAAPQEIARTLGVRALLDGTVRRAGGHVRVKVDLTSADSGTVLWTNTYDREIKDVFALQDSRTASRRPSRRSSASCSPGERWWRAAPGERPTPRRTISTCAGWKRIERRMRPACGSRWITTGARS